MSHQQNCPVCGSDSITPFLTRDQVPVNQNLVMESQESARNIRRGTLALGVCESCGFVFNMAFDLSKLSYDAHYDNTQTYSPFFNDYVSGLIRHLVYDKNVQNAQIVEVGCGKGLFLRALVEFEGAKNSGYGFDTSYVGPEVDLDGRLHFEKRFYTADCTDIPADVIVCRHVIEHIPDPVEFLGIIKQALVNSPEARIFFETPTVEWILRNRVIWDFFYEHCSYFTAESLTTAFEAAGFQVESVEHIFGRQYLWLEATIPMEKPVVSKKPGAIPQLAQEFATSERDRTSQWAAKLQTLTTQGKVALWGAGAKGVTFANLLDPDCQQIACVVDLNPQKQGHFLPGTGHPIVSYQAMAEYGIRTALMLNPNYREESLKLLRDVHLAIDLVTLD
ncbi:MAG: methyltransferase domain-containing protein [Chloroflexota bacterium]